MPAPETSRWISREQTAHDQLTPALLARFRATFDRDPAESTVPAGLHWCLCTPEAPTAALGPDGHPARGGFLPPIDLPRRMWAASDIAFLAPLTPGAAIQRRSTVAAIEDKTGASGPLVFVRVDHLTSANGTPAIRERQTLVYRPAPTGAPADPVPPAPAPTAAADGLTLHATHLPTAPLLFRYSALTFNSHRIHYDQAYATGTEGWAAPIVHGPLIATLLMAVAEAEAPKGAALATFSFRALSPAFVDQPLHLFAAPHDGKLRLEARGGNQQVHMAATAGYIP